MKPKWNRIIMFMAFMAIVVVLTLAYVQAITVDDGFFPYEYGWNSTSQVMTNWDSLNYRTNTNGIITVGKDQGHLSDFGFGITGKINDIPRKYTTQNFTWSWEHVEFADQHTFIAYNNYPAFNWTMYFQFTPTEPLKIKHVITNDLGMPITEAKFWYINSMREGTLVEWNGVIYELTSDLDIHLQGNFNDVLPTVDILHNYIFNHSDIIEDGFDITDIYIGNGSIVGHADKLIIAVGVTKGAGNLPDGFTIEIDPLLEAVETTNNVGKNAHIIVNSSGVPHILYDDTTNTKIRMCIQASDFSWDCAEVGDDRFFGAERFVAIDWNQEWHMSDRYSVSGRLIYKNTTDPLSWPAHYWNASQGDYPQRDSSIVVDANREAFIIAENLTASNLRWLQWNNGTGSTWTQGSRKIYTTADDWSVKPTAVIDSRGIIHTLSRRLSPNDEVMYCNNTGGSWGCVAPVYDFGSGARGDISTDWNGTPHISFSNNTGVGHCYQNSSASWACAIINTDTAGSTPATFIDNYQDKTFIAFYNSSKTLHVCDNHNNKTAWNCTRILTGADTRQGDGSYRFAIKQGWQVNATYGDQWHFTHYNSSGGDLIYINGSITRPVPSASSPAGAGGGGGGGGRRLIEELIPTLCEDLIDPLSRAFTAWISKATFETTGDMIRAFFDWLFCNLQTTLIGFDNSTAGG